MPISPPSGLVSSRSKPTARRPDSCAASRSAVVVASTNSSGRSKTWRRHELSTRIVASMSCGAKPTLTDR